MCYPSLVMRYLYQMAVVKSRTDDTRKIQKTLIESGTLPFIFQFFQQHHSFALTSNDADLNASIVFMFARRSHDHPVDVILFLGLDDWHFFTNCRVCDRRL